MDKAFEMIRQDDVLSGMRQLFLDLSHTRSQLAPPEWLQFAKMQAMNHPVRAIAHMCPMTRRSFDKPRGYAGDAVMLDHIYGIEHPGPDYHPATLAGKIYAYTVNSPASRAVRFRRQLLAGLIDSTVARCGTGKARVLSIAAGHLREAEISTTVKQCALVEFVAFDQDQESLDVIERDYAQYGVTARHGSVRQLLKGRDDFTGFDLVYAAGLFDYLEQSTAQRLVERMQGMLNPGGKLLIANFTHNVPDAGYMEAFMDWWLIYRGKDEMISLFESFSTSVTNPEIFFDPGENIVFAEWTNNPH